MQKVEKNLVLGKESIVSKVDTNFDNFYMHKMLERRLCILWGNSGVGMAYSSYNPLPHKEVRI